MRDGAPKRGATRCSIAFVDPLRVELRCEAGGRCNTSEWEPPRAVRWARRKRRVPSAGSGRKAGRAAGQAARTVTAAKASTRSCSIFSHWLHPPSSEPRPSRAAAAKSVTLTVRLSAGPSGKACCGVSAMGSAASARNAGDDSSGDVSLVAAATTLRDNGFFEWVASVRNRRDTVSLSMTLAVLPA